VLYVLYVYECYGGWAGLITVGRVHVRAGCRFGWIRCDSEWHFVGVSAVMVVVKVLWILACYH